MIRGGEPVLDNALELVGGEVRVRCAHDLHHRVLTAGQRGLEVALEQRGERLLVFPLRVLGTQRSDAVDGEEELEIQRLLGPQSTVIVEYSDAFCDRHEIGRAGLRDLRDERGNGLLRLTVVPGRQLASGLRDTRRCEPARQERDQEWVMCHCSLLFLGHSSVIIPTVKAPATMNCVRRVTQTSTVPLSVNRVEVNTIRVALQATRMTGASASPAEILQPKANAISAKSSVSETSEEIGRAHV